MKTFHHFLFAIVVCACISQVHAQESCYEQYFREHNKEIFPAIDENDDSYDELKKMALARQLMHNEAFMAERTYPSRPNTQAETLFQPLLLAIDTVTGICHLLSEDGAVLAVAHIAMVDSTWYMWLSVDPLVDKNIATSPYAYANNNPVKYIDPIGLDTIDINSRGYCVRYTKSSENDVVRLVGNNGVRSQSVFEHGSVSIEGQEDYRSSNGYVGERHLDRGGSYLMISTKTADIAGQIFDMLKNDVIVEFMMANTNIDKGKSFLISSHETNSVTYRIPSVSYNKILSYTHNHPTNPSPSSADLGRRDKVLQANPNVTFYIWSVVTNQLINYTNYSVK